MSSISALGSPIPLSEIETVLAWVDTFQLSKPTKKINRDFSDAVLLAEILAVNYPKLVEMHNYPPRNSHALKLNNWMTLNRKVLKKLKLNLCCNTMEQLANSAPGVIERILVMVRDKIRRDDELNKTMRDAEHNMSSGGSYYEACGDDEHVLVVPVKTRVNGVLETIQQKVISHDLYLAMKEELKDAKDTTDLLRQKVDHLDSLLKIKEERIQNLQKQLERKQSRRKEIETIPNCLSVPFDESAPPSPIAENGAINALTKTQSLKNIDTNSKIKEESRIPRAESLSSKATPKPSISDVTIAFRDSKTEIDRTNSDVFEEAEVIGMKNECDAEEFKDSEQVGIVTIEDVIQKEIKDIVKPLDTENISYFN